MAMDGLKNFTNSIGDKFKSNMKTPLINGETFIKSVGASRFVKGGVNFGGTLFLTNMRIVFETNSMNSKLKSITDIINVSEVREYCKADNVGLGNMIVFPGFNKNKAVFIRTSTDSYQYVPLHIDEIINILGEICPNAIQVEKSSYAKALKDNLFGGEGTGLQSNPQANTQLNISVDVTDEIIKYKELFDMGAITQEEFDAKKKQLLGI